MSFGYSIGDFCALPALAWNVYRSCRDASDDFKGISQEVEALNILLKETEGYFSSRQSTLNPEREHQLYVLGEGCRTVLSDLQKLLAKHEALSGNSQRTWDLLRWGLEDIANIRERLISNVGLLTAFNSSLANTSQAQIEKKLNKLLAELGAGSDTASVVSTHTMDSLSPQDNLTWRELRKALETVGISIAVQRTHRQFIIDTLEKAFAEHNSLESVQEDLEIREPGFVEVTPDLEHDLIAQAPKTVSRRPLPDEIEKKSPNDHEKSPEQAATVSGLFVNSSTLVDAQSMLFGAAETGSLEGIEEALSLYANINSPILNGTTKGNTALHLAALNSHVSAVRLLLDRGAEIDKRGYHNVTALCLAAAEGNTSVVTLLLAMGADVHATDDSGMTALQVATRRGHKDVAQLLSMNCAIVDGMRTHHNWLRSVDNDYENLETDTILRKNCLLRVPRVDTYRREKALFDGPGGLKPRRHTHSSEHPLSSPSPSLSLQRSFTSEYLLSCGVVRLKGVSKRETMTYEMSLRQQIRQCLL